MKIRTYRLGVMTGMLTLGLIASASFAGAKLDRRQAEALNRASYHTGEIAKALPEIQKTQELMGKSEDASKIPQKVVTDQIEQCKMLNNRLDQAERAMKNIDDNHPDIKAMNQTIADQRAALNGATEAAKAFSAKLGDVRDVSKYPNFQKDMASLRAYAKAYAKFRFVDDPKRVADIKSHWQDDIKACQAMLQTYRPLVDQQTPEGKEFSNCYASVAAGVKWFQGEAQGFVNKAGGEIDEELAGALKMAQTASAEKKPAFFDGGVKQKMDAARKSLAVFVAIAGETHEASVALTTKVVDHEKQIAALKDTLKEQILASTPTPPDTYKGADKAALRDQILSTWKEKFPEDQVLGVRFIQEQWKRNSGASWNAGNKSWDNFDQSGLTARVAVKKDDHLATLYYVDLQKDHMAGDQVKVTAGKGGTWVIEDMLLSNWKP